MLPFKFDNVAAHRIAVGGCASPAAGSCASFAVGGGASPAAAGCAAIAAVGCASIAAGLLLADCGICRLDSVAF
jgi:hypothetical protein